VIPANSKPAMRVTVAAVIIKALHELKLEYPKVGKRRRGELLEIRKALEG